MSDYISIEVLLEELNRYEEELYKDKRDAIDSDDEMMLFAISNQETAITRIQKYVMHSIPAVDEKEVNTNYFQPDDVDFIVRLKEQVESWGKRK